MLFNSGKLHNFKKNINLCPLQWFTAEHTVTSCLNRRKLCFTWYHHLLLLTTVAQMYAGHFTTYALTHRHVRSRADESISHTVYQLTGNAEIA